MPNFVWKGRTRAGKAQEGVLVAEHKDAVISLLRKQQIMVTSVTEKGKEFALPKFAMYKRILAKVLCEKFIVDRGWSEERAVAFGTQVLKDNTKLVFGVG